MKEEKDKSKINLDKELETLIVKHKICRYDNKGILGIDYSCCFSCELRGDCLHGRIKSLICRLFDDIPDGFTVAVRGAGWHTIELLKVIKERKHKISFIIDRNNEINELYGIPIVHVNEMKDKRIDLMIISSFIYREEMKKEQSLKGCDKYSVIDIYDYIDEKDEVSCSNHDVYSCVFMTHNLEGLAVSWNGVVCIKKIYKRVLSTGNVTLIQKYLYELILSYLNVRDFLNAERYIELYIKKQYRNWEVFEEFLISLGVLLQKIKEVLIKRKNESLVVFHFDALENDMIEHMEYMRNLRDRFSVFNNAFTQYNYTTSTWQTMFTQRDLIDAGAYEVESFDDNNSKLLNMLRKKNYRFYMSTSKYKLFFKEKDTTKIYINVMTRRLWDLLQVLVDDEKAFCYLHFLETHSPFTSCFSDICYEQTEYMKLQENEQAAILLECLNYVDEQFEFYNSIIPDCNTKVIMSDHGSYQLFSLDNYHINDCKTNDHSMYGGLKTVLFFYKEGLKPNRFDQVFSLVNFTDFVSYLIGEADEYAMFTDYSKIQLPPIYDKMLMDVYDEFKHPLPLPTKGIATAYEKYLIDYNGKETYQTFQSDDFRKNRINEPEYQERINELRELCGNDFHDIFEQPKFAYAKKIYKEKGLI